MSKISISVLDQVIREKPTKENRLTELLKDPSAEAPEGWYMCVPSCFNDALDIRLTSRSVNKQKLLVWTQGSSFYFNAGDTIYDTADAYKVWSEALKSIGICVQVKVGLSAGLNEGGTGRYGGSVTFAILTPNKDRSKIVECCQHSMSQDDFVRFLISGPTDELKRKIEKGKAKVLG